MQGDLLPESLRRRLIDELRREAPPGVEEHIDDLLDTIFDLHRRMGDRPDPLAFDFRSLSGESLLPSGEESFGVADFLKVSQLFERSMVGLILASEITPDEKAHFIGGIQDFFDGFDTTLLGQLEEELVEKGLIRGAVALEPAIIRRLLGHFGLSMELAGELADPVLLEVDGRIVYANRSAESLLGADALRQSCFGPTGIIGTSAESGDDPGEWHHASALIPTAQGKESQIPTAWKTVSPPEGEATLVMLPGATALRSAGEKVDDLTRESRRFQVLYRLSREISKGYDIDGLFTRLTEELSELIGYDAIMLHIRDSAKERGLFHLAASVPTDLLKALWENSICTLGAFVPGIEDADAEMNVVNPELLVDASPTAGFASAKKAQEYRLTGSLFIFPLLFEDEVLGSLGLHLPEEAPFSDEDLQLFSTFTNHLALALKNMVAVEGMRKLLRDNREQIDLARRVQMELLPKPEEFKRLKFRTLFKPAAGLSGDFYQFFAKPDVEGLIIGDASGHGISASLIMAVAGETFRDACSGDMNKPAEVLLKTNASLKEALGDDFFVTALIFAVNPDTLQASFATAGQAGPLLIKPDGKIRYLKTVGIPLGMFDPPPPYQTRHVNLKPGDRLLFFTDGAVEGHNTKGEIYGMKRLRSRIKRNVNLTGDELLQTIADDIATFLTASDRSDDMTLILMEVT